MFTNEISDNHNSLNPVYSTYMYRKLMFFSSVISAKLICLTASQQVHSYVPAKYHMYK